MNKYLRNENFRWLSISLACEFIFSAVLGIFLLDYAQHYADHKATLITFGIVLVANHGVTSFLSIWGLLTVDRHTAVTLSHQYQKTVYWNALICGFLFYPVFVAWFAYRHSGYTQDEINDFTKMYIYKNFTIVSQIATVTDKLDAKFKTEHSNVEELIKDKKLTLIEGNKYLFDYLYKKEIITDALLIEVQKQYLEKIIEAAI